jgi:hypothetical protein
MADDVDICFYHMNFIIRFHYEARWHFTGFVCLFSYFERSVNSLVLRKFYIEGFNEILNDFKNVV